MPYREIARAWGGFVDDKLDCVMVNDGYQTEGKAFQIFTRKRDVKARYEDVRCVVISELNDE